MVTKYSRVLHTDHAILVRLKYSLCGLYGRCRGYELQNLNNTQLLRKRQLCQETLSSLDKLQPGYTCRRGMILYEYHTVLLILGLSKHQAQPAEAKKDLKLSLKCLRECLKILK